MGKWRGERSIFCLHSVFINKAFQTANTIWSFCHSIYVTFPYEILVLLIFNNQLEDKI